jgi:hypothetical protein
VDESVCPFCNKNLSMAARTLNAPIKDVMDLHISVHLHEKWRTLYDLVETVIASASLAPNIAAVPMEDYIALRSAFFAIKQAEELLGAPEQNRGQSEEEKLK